MNSLYPQAWANYLNVMMILLRLLGFFLLMPGFSHQAIPVSVKVCLAFSLSLVLWPFLSSYLPLLPQSIGGIALVALRETAVGLLMGLAAVITFEAISLAAQFVGYQIGFGTAALIDPQNQSHVSVLVPLQGWLALLVFFLTDMHHEMLRLFVLSFQITGSASQQLLADSSLQPLLKFFLTLSAKLFALAVQMAAPFTCLVLICNAAIGILSRLLPQMNILLFSFPITITLGLCAFYLLAPEMLIHFENILGEMSADVLTLLRTL